MTEAMTRAAHLEFGKLVIFVDHMDSAFSYLVMAVRSADVTVALPHSALIRGPEDKSDILSRMREESLGAKFEIAPASLPGAWSAVLRTRFFAFPAAPGSERLRTVWMPVWAAGSSFLIFANELPPRLGQFDSPVIGAWQRFAHPRQRTGSALSGADVSLAVEIAAVVRPSLIVLAGKLRGRPIIITATDQITAELA